MERSTQPSCLLDIDLVSPTWWPKMTFMFSNIANSIRWFVSLGSKFLRVVPGYTILAVICSVLSQFLLLAGFLLPLKVVLLLGRSSVPGYFPLFLQGIGHDGLVLVLSIASVIFYLLHLLADKLVELSATKGSERLLKKSRKMAIFENQHGIASKGYHRFTQAMAALCFVTACVLAMSLFYGKLVLAIIIYILTAIFVICCIVNVSVSVYKKISTALGPVVKLLASVGFLIAFGFIVLDHLYGDPPGLLLSVISLLLTRQLLSRTANFVKDLQGLYGQKAQLSALFFHGQVFVAQPKQHARGIWDVVKPDVRDEWLGNLLESETGGPVMGFSVCWLDIGVPDVVAYEVSVACPDGNKKLLVKLFNANRSAWAKHEATLLASQGSIPTLPLIALRDIQGFHCHIFDLTEFVCCDADELKTQLASFRNMLAAAQPPTDLAAIYVRSKPQIWQRFDKEMVFRLQYLLDGKIDKNIFDTFLEILPGIRQVLSKLPLAVFTPDIRRGMLWKDKDERYVLAHWARWDLEPIGVGWPSASNEGNKLSGLLERTKASRPDTHSLCESEARLAALLFEFESHLLRWRYVEAYNLIEPMISEYESI